MRRTLPFPRISRDARATAPYAVVAVIILLGASMSYAYLAHLNASRLRSEGAEPWSEGAREVLEAEEAAFRDALRAALDAAVSTHDGAPSHDLVASIGVEADGELDGWASSRYPHLRGELALMASDPRLSVSATYGTVVTGNVLGQQMPQRLPVGLEAVAAVTITVRADGGAVLSRDVTARVHRTEPAVLAAHLHNVMEHALADEGLVPLLLVDALSRGLAEDPSWVPGEDALEEAVDRAVGAVERCLFHADTGPSALLFGAGDQVSGTTLLGPGRQGRVLLAMPAEGTVTLEDPATGASQQVRLVPWLEWRAREVDLRSSQLWSAEAGGPGGAVIARLDVAGRFHHRVDVWSGDTRTGSVTRTIDFRDHLVAWAEAPELFTGGGRRMGRAQVEDWDDLRATMAVVSPPARQVVLRVSPDFGPTAQVALDGAHLGVVDVGEVLLENVPSGPHQLLVGSTPGAASPATLSQGISVPATGPVPVIDVRPREGDGTGAAYAFWFSVMAAQHRPGSGPLAHLEHIASLTGYAGLDDAARSDPRDHLGEVLFWVEGLDRHLDYRGGQLEQKGSPEPLATWKLAKEVVSLSKLTLGLLTELPGTLDDASDVVIELSSAGGRATFLVRIQDEAATLDLVEAVEEADGTCTVGFLAGAGVIVKRASSMLSALSIIGKSLTVGLDLVELRDATAEGNGTAIAWAVYDLGVDIAQMVISAVKFACDLGVMVLRKVTGAVLSVIGSAISVVAAFLDAYRDAGCDFWGAWELLLSPDTFGDALRTAGFLSAMASLVTTVVVTAAFHVLGGIGLSVAFTMAVAAATGVGLVVLAAALAVWAVLHWEEIGCWYHGSVSSDDVDALEGDVSSMMDDTLQLMAGLNAVNVTAEVAGARMERGVGLALLSLRSSSGDAGLVAALSGAPHHHLDSGSAQGRRARAVAEARHWIVNLWREVDDLVDDDHATLDGEHSEGFPDDAGLGRKDHDFDADVRVRSGDGTPGSFDQRGLVGFLRTARPASVEGLTVRVRVEGDLFEEALKEWVRALEAIGSQLAEATSMLVLASRETAFAASTLAEADYDRDRALVEVRLPRKVDTARVLVECTDGAVMVDGEPVEGPVLLHMGNATELLTVTGRSVVSEVVSYDSGDFLDIDLTVDCTASLWCELGFGRSVLAHAPA